jgi:hypothetical protein
MSETKCKSAENFKKGVKCKRNNNIADQHKTNMQEKATKEF